MGDVKIYFNWVKNLIRRAYYDEDFNKAHWSMCKEGLIESYQISEFKQIIEPQIKELILELTDTKLNLEELSKEVLKTLFDKITAINQTILQLYNFQDLIE